MTGYAARRKKREKQDQVLAAIAAGIVKSHLERQGLPWRFTVADEDVSEVVRELIRQNRVWFWGEAGELEVNTDWSL